MATAPEIEIDEELKKSLDYCDKMIAEGDDLSADFFTMLKRSLLSGDSKFEDWNNERVKL